MIFSIIVPFLNEQRHIKDSIISLLEQDFNKNEYEIIFVDTGSEDRSLDIVKQFPRVRVFREKKKCPYAARNTALGFARGDDACCSSVMARTISLILSSDSDSVG